MPSEHNIDTGLNLLMKLIVKPPYKNFSTLKIPCAQSLLPIFTCLLKDCLILKLFKLQCQSTYEKIHNSILLLRLCRKDLYLLLMKADKDMK